MKPPIIIKSSLRKNTRHIIPPIKPEEIKKMSFQKKSRMLLNQRGTYGHTERQILIALIGIGIAIYFPNRQLGFGRALLITLKWEGCILGSLLALFFVVWSTGKLIHRFRKKN